MHKHLFLLAFLALLSGCLNKVSLVNTGSQPITHELWTEILQKHVTEEGYVDYEGIQRDSARFNEYVALLSSAHPNEKNWSRNERLAYWYNAYNAFTIDLILDHYPVASIKDIKSGIPFVNTVWDIKFINIEEKEYDLNNIEHGIVRPYFNEPRSHFALNCASFSCPKLRNEAYEADRLEEQLDDQARAFLNDPYKNKITPQRVRISKLFNWYEGDFVDNKDKLIAYLNKYSEVQIEPGATIEYAEYLWPLNTAENYRAGSVVAFE